MKKNSKTVLTLFLACLLSSYPCLQTSASKTKKSKKPTLTISVSPTSINEGQNASFTIAASTINPSQSITVNYSMSGTGVLGTHFTLSGTVGRATIPPGNSSTTITLSALTTNLVTGSETVTMTLTSGSGYKVGKGKKAPKATVTIFNVNSLPNLIPYQPAGWSDRIVVSNAPGTTTDTATLLPTDTLYLDWAVLNNSGTDIAADFTTALYVDGALKATWSNPPPTNANFYRFILDYNLGSLSSGTHTLQIIADSGNAIAESNESDNSYTKTITVGSTSPLQITGVSNSSPLPLTVLTISTAGLNQSGAIDVQFANSSGFAADEDPIRVGSDGSVVVGVPLYIDPMSNQITSGTVSIILMQNGNSSTPVSITIENLPTLDTYGVQPGQITHDFLVFEATLLGHRLNYFQTAQVLQAGVDTTAAQGDTKALLVGAVKGKHDVDAIMTNNSTTLTWGNLTDGTPVQFDKDQLDVTDRVLAVYLIEQFSGLVSPGPVAARASSSLDSTSPCNECLVMDQVLKLFVNGNGASMVKYIQGNGSGIDAGLAAVQSLGGGVLNASKNTIGPGPGATVGLLTGFGRIYENITNTFTDVTNAATCGGDPSCINADVLLIKLDTDARNIATSIAATVANIPDIAGLADNTAQTVSGLLGACSTLVNDISSGAEQRDNQNLDTVIDPSILADVGRVTGVVNLSNGQAPSDQGSIGYCCFGTGALGITGVDDSGGNYDVFLPVGVAGTTYNNMTMTVGDLTTGHTLGSQTVDLTGLDTSQPIQLPPLSVTPPSTTTYDGTYLGQISGNLTCVLPDGSTIVQPVPVSAFGFTLVNGAVVGSGLTGGVDPFGHLNITIPVSGVGAVIFDGTISFTGSANGSWSVSGVPTGCSEGGMWFAQRQ